MPRAPAAQRVAAARLAPTIAALLSPARAEASRNNGAKSKGPKTPKGKARASRNALRHGLCAEQHVLVEGESAAAFAAFEQALLEDLAPEGALQTLLAGRIARAAWRLERAERIEAELFARQMDAPFGDGDLGLALVRDGNGARAFDTLLRYRAAAQGELFRTLRTLKALQAEATQEPVSQRARPQPEAAPDPELPNQPETRGNADQSTTQATHRAEAHERPGPPVAGSGLGLVRAASTAGSAPAPDARAPVAPEPPNGPERRANPGL